MPNEKSKSIIKFKYSEIFVSSWIGIIDDPVRPWASKLKKNLKVSGSRKKNANAAPHKNKNGAKNNIARTNFFSFLNKAGAKKR